MIIKRLYSSQEVVEGLHLVWDVFIRENAVLSRWRILCLLSKAER